MQFTDGARVSSVDGQEIGRITHVVLNPETYQATHLVIRRGVIFAEARVIPLRMVFETTPQSVILRGEKADFADFPEFEEVVYVTNELPREAVSSVSSSIGGYLNPPVDFATDDFDISNSVSAIGQPYMKTICHNVPDDTVAVKTNARVVSEDYQVVGRIEGVQVDAETENITHVIVSQGRLLKVRRCLPVFRCEFIAENRVDIAVHADSLKALPEYSSLKRNSLI